MILHSILGMALWGPFVSTGCQQMTGGAANVVFGRCHPDSLHPDLAWLEEQLQQPSPPRMVVLVNPNNPTGAFAGRVVKYLDKKSCSVRLCRCCQAQPLTASSRTCP